MIDKREESIAKNWSHSFLLAKSFHGLESEMRSWIESRNYNSVKLLKAYIILIAGHVFRCFFVRSVVDTGGTWRPADLRVFALLGLLHHVCSVNNINTWIGHGKMTISCAQNSYAIGEQKWLSLY